MSDHLPELGLRDYFAAAALTGLVAADRDFRVDDAASGSAAYAALAYWIADAMLVRRITIAEASAIPPHITEVETSYKGAKVVLKR